MNIDRAVPKPPRILITGVSGAGLSSALKSFEDMGYQAFDHLPISFIPLLLTEETLLQSPLALTVDCRSRDFSAAALRRIIATSEQHAPSKKGKNILIFLDCDDEILQRRFSETRRRHPLADGRPLKDGLALERTLLADVKEMADLVINTTSLTSRDLKKLLEASIENVFQQELQIFIQSFSFRHGLPREADMVYDVRFLQNPHYVAELKHETGLRVLVQEYVQADTNFLVFFNQLCDQLSHLLPLFKQEGKTYLNLAVGCTGGQHRSVVVVEKLTIWLRNKGWKVVKRHREIIDDNDGNISG
ncbi:MAG: RNase adapter RapZ [Alphaproteobacteria bacterium]